MKLPRHQTSFSWMKCLHQTAVDSGMPMDMRSAAVRSRTTSNTSVVSPPPPPIGLASSPPLANALDRLAGAEWTEREGRSPDAR